jgi:hypothetical protein
MDGHHDFLSRYLTVTKRDVTPHLVVFIPTSTTERPDESIPRDVPGKFAHTTTSTVASSIAASSGIGSPCFRQLSR